LNPLTVIDFRAALLTCKALNGMMYFNCGFNSGASIPHKHMQVIPYDALYGGVLPFELAADRHASTSSSGEVLFKLPEYKKIKHIVCDLKVAGVDFLMGAQEDSGEEGGVEEELEE
jgi:ATP adenylyltransferase/5',5'''-P-1,P-4-tetraphosphate phosphorylase II